ncbi:MAG TPA: hypothetical protein VK157_02105 [Phycisphaerales bacterium]|nr:hypothetical protein [Phycisphaerales bacterium]
MIFGDVDLFAISVVDAITDQIENPDRRTAVTMNYYAAGVMLNDSGGSWERANDLYDVLCDLRARLGRLDNAELWHVPGHVLLCAIAEKEYAIPAHSSVAQDISAVDTKNLLVIPNNLETFDVGWTALVVGPSVCRVIGLKPHRDDALGDSARITAADIVDVKVDRAAFSSVVSDAQSWLQQRMR